MTLNTLIDCDLIVITRLEINMMARFLTQQPPTKVGGLVLTC